MNWTDQDKERLFLMLESIRNLLATICDFLEKLTDRPPPPARPSSKPPRRV